MSRVTVRQIATALGITKRSAERRASSNGWQYQELDHRGGKRRLYAINDLPADVQAALFKHDPDLSPIAASIDPEPAGKAPFTYDPEALWAYYERRPNPLKARAKQRLQLLDQVMRLVDAGRGIELAFQQVGQANGVPWKTIRGWYHGTNGKPGAKHYARADWLAGLLPGYTGRTATAACSREAWDWFKADYLRLEAPAASACYRRLKRIAAERDWTVPSLKTFERRIKAEIPRPVRILARQGAEALQRAYPAQLRDHSVFSALEAVNADGHKFDVFVRWPDGTIGRPCMVAWQDIYSGKVLAWRVDQTEHTDSVRLSFGDMVERYGIPAHAYLDNGRGFASKWMTGGAPNRYRFKVREEEPAGILTTLGVAVHWATPYHGQAKPIERAFRDLAEDVAKHPAFAGAYTGNNPTAKPENYGSRAIPIDQFITVLNEEIHAHNAREGRRSAVCNGRSFDTVFAASYGAAPIRKATDAQRRLWLLAAELASSRQDGTITIPTDRRNRYWCAELGHYAGNRVIVRFDPQRLHECVYAYTLDGRYIGQADCIEAAGFDDSQAAREHSRARKQWMRSQKTQLDAERRMDAAEAAAMLPATVAPEPLEARVVRMHRPDRAPQVPPSQPDPDIDAAMQRITEPQPHAETARVFELDPVSRYRLWQRLDVRSARGEQLLDADAKWWREYQKSEEFASMDGFYRDFGREEQTG